MKQETLLGFTQIGPSMRVISSAIFCPATESCRESYSYVIDIQSHDSRYYSQYFILGYSNIFLDNSYMCNLTKYIHMRIAAKILERLNKLDFGENEPGYQSVGIV